VIPVYVPLSRQQGCEAGGLTDDYKAEISEPHTQTSTMSQFNDAVSTLLRAFSDGISIIKTQRGRRKKEKLPIDSSRRAAEIHLNKSLKKNRAEVKSAYERDVARFGPGFQVGDGEFLILLRFGFKI